METCGSYREGEVIPSLIDMPEDSEALSRVNQSD